MAYKFSKEKFLNSELGGELQNIVICLSDIRYRMDLYNSRNMSFGMEKAKLQRDYEILLPQLKIILLALKQFYDLNCKYDYSVINKEDAFEEKDFFVYIENEEKEILFVDDYYKIRLRKISRAMFD